MQDLKKFFPTKPIIPVGVFFVAFLLIGLVIFKDYGIHLDEFNNLNYGRRWTDYAYAVIKAHSLSVPLPTDIWKEMDLRHGPAFEIFLQVVKDLLRLNDSRDVFLARHLCVFLLFYTGVIFFYFLCRRIFKSWRLALLGSIFLVLSPRIFANAFYDSFDIAFLVFFIIGIFTLFRILDRKTVASVAIHALACAILINIRLNGIFLPALTVFLLLFEIICIRSFLEKCQALRALVCFIMIFFVLVIVFNPFLWASPFERFSALIQEVVEFRWPYPKPWYWGPLFIAVSTPVLYVVLFLIGIFVAIRMLLMYTPKRYLARRNITILCLCFFLPLIVSVGKIYGSWRHLFFIYPIFLIFSLMGVRYVWQRIGSVARLVFLGSLTFGLLATVFSMVRNHPYQNVYFNQFAGDPREIWKRFDLDYFALSTRQALEYVLKTDNDTIIPVFFDAGNISLMYSQILLPEQRIRFVESDCEKAKYVIAIYHRSGKWKYSAKVYYSIVVDGITIATIYKLNDGESFRRGARLNRMLGIFD